MYRTAIRLGCIFAALGVILGAFGAHALKQILPPDQLQIFETGVRYQMYHAFGLLASGIIYQYFTHSAVKLSTTFFTIGIILFSGSLYAMTLLKANGEIGIGGFGILTPIGGLFFIAGWISMLAGVLRKNN